MYRKHVKSRWFALADFLFVSIAILLWVLYPTQIWISLILALLPWAARIFVGLFPFRRTRFDLLILILIVTAVIGIWAAYNRQTAWAKFCLLIGAVLLYYSLAGQPPENLWIIAGIFALLGIGVAVFFFFTHDWTAYPAKIILVNEAGYSWQKIRPNFPFEGIHPNDAAGVMAMMAPFLAAWGVHAWRDKRIAIITATLTAVIGLFVVFILTSSRGAWAALAAAFGIWLLWIVSKEIHQRIKIKAEVIFSLGVGTVIVLGLLTLTQYPDYLLEFQRAIPGLDSAASRQELAQQTIQLINDFPYTGGGLGGFPGLYSQYILVTPVYYLADGHNLFLDIALEGGILALIVIMLLFTGSWWILIPPAGKDTYPPNHKDLLRWGILSSFMVVLIHGMVDDWIFSDRGLPLLFTLPGFSIALSHTYQQKGNKSINHRAGGAMMKWKSLIAVGLVMFAGAGMYLNYARLLSAWYANMGAVLMSQVEISEFPSNQWEDGSKVVDLWRAEQFLHEALKYNPDNRTANDRLGQISMLRRDYPAAIEYLEKANHLDPSHRGIQKNLGYSYLWVGQFDAASRLIAGFPEIRSELDAYRWWWSSHGHQELADKAHKMSVELHLSAGD